VLDCGRTLPLAEALAVADSALHRQIVGKPELVSAAAQLRGPHCRRIQRVAQLADGRPESVLESALRAILIEAGIEGFVPQVTVADGAFSARLDLGHPLLRIGLEADGFEHHGTRRALVRDCRRHVNLTIRGWRLLRFSWEDVMYDPDWVVAAVRQAIGLPQLTEHHLRAA
jgi:very-short-patch-repair endonuclease